MKTTPILTVLAALPSLASAQSFNIDVGDPALGLPASTYGAAAGQTGVWTAIDGDGGATGLVDVTGAATLVDCIIVPGAGSAGNWTANNPATSGDDALLLDDLHDVGPEAFGAVGVFSFFGIADGTYDVYTYSWAPDFPNYTTEIEVVGSVDPPQVVGGVDWTGSHVLGQTYARHRVTVTGGLLDVVATTAGTGEYGSINGFQFVEVVLGSNYCLSTPNSTGSPAVMSAAGSASIAANDLELLAGPVPAQPGLFFYGPAQTLQAFGNGFRCVGGQVVRLPVITPSAGQFAYTVDNTMLPPGSTFTAGSTWYFQCWYRDPAGGGASFDLSDGLEVLFLP